MKKISRLASAQTMAVVQAFDGRSQKRSLQLRLVRRAKRLPEPLQ